MVLLLRRGGISVTKRERQEERNYPHKLLRKEKRFIMEKGTIYIYLDKDTGILYMKRIGLFDDLWVRVDNGK